VFSGLGSSSVFSFNLLTWLSTSPTLFIQAHRNCFIYFRNLEIASNWQQQTHRGLLLIVFTNLPVGDRSLKALIMFAPIVQLLNCCRLLIISLLQQQICVIHTYFRFMGLRRSWMGFIYWPLNSSGNLISQPEVFKLAQAVKQISKRKYQRVKMV